MVRNYVVAIKTESGIVIQTVRASTARIAQSKGVKEAASQLEGHDVELVKAMTDTAYEKSVANGTPIFEEIPAPESADPNDPVNAFPVDEPVVGESEEVVADPAPAPESEELPRPTKWSPETPNGARPKTETRVDSLKVDEGPGVMAYVISDFLPDDLNRIVVTDKKYCLASLEATKFADGAYVVSYIRIPVDYRKTTECLCRLMRGLREFAETRGIQVILSDPGKYGGMAWGTVRNTAAEAGLEKWEGKRGILTCGTPAKLEEGKNLGQAEFRKFVYQVNARA